MQGLEHSRRIIDHTAVREAVDGVMRIRQDGMSELTSCELEVKSHHET